MKKLRLTYAWKDNEDKDIHKSPYLNGPQRLADVIAAIQAMAVHESYKLDFAGWAGRISGDSKPSQAEHWRKVFEEHPEFFRLDSERAKASLVWRRQFPKNYNVVKGCELSEKELDNLGRNEKDSELSRRPLSPADINTLITTAINLHSCALEEKKESRWLYDVLVTALVAIAGLIGAVIGGYLSAGR